MKKTNIWVQINWTTGAGVKTHHHTTLLVEMPSHYSESDISQRVDIAAASHASMHNYRACDQAYEWDYAL